jgi:hypothetical protein
MMVTRLLVAFTTERGALADNPLINFSWAWRYSICELGPEVAVKPMVSFRTSWQ